MDPGLGKTTAVAVLLQEILRDSEIRQKGVLICLSTKRAIQDLVTEANLAAADFAVVTSDPLLSGLSPTLPEEAPVLFTTQQMLTSKSSGRRFAEIGEFRFCGKVRKLRIWDESMLPASPIVLDADEISRLLGRIRPVNGTLADQLDQLANSAKRTPGGRVLQLPRIATALSKATSGHGGITSEDKDIIDRLISLSDTHVRVRKEIRGGSRSCTASPGKSTILVGFGNELPEDLAPAVVLDASGRVRRTYQLWQEERFSLVRLKSVIRDYSKLTVHVWDHWAGRGTIYSPARYPAMRQALERTIQKDPWSNWLVVHHKQKGHNPDLFAELQGRVSGKGGPLHSLTWGMHHGTNLYRGCDRVILAGLFYTPRSHYEGLVYAASGIAPDRRQATSRDIEQMQLAELLHDIYQAACRGKVRSGSSQECQLYLMASRKSGVRRALPGLFPGCTVKDWFPPAATRLPPRVQSALNEIETALNSGGPVAFTKVQKALRMKSSQFNQHIR